VERRSLCGVTSCFVFKLLSSAERKGESESKGSDWVRESEQLVYDLRVSGLLFLCSFTISCEIGQEEKDTWTCFCPPLVLRFIFMRSQQAENVQRLNGSVTISSKQELQAVDLSCRRMEYLNGKVYFLMRR
jgi:hypothetical protein